MIFIWPSSKFYFIPQPRLDARTPVRPSPIGASPFQNTDLCQNEGRCQPSCDEPPYFVCECKEGWEGDNCTLQVTYSSSGDHAYEVPQALRLSEKPFLKPCALSMVLVCLSQLDDNDLRLKSLSCAMIIQTIAILQFIQAISLDT